MKMYALWIGGLALAAMLAGCSGSGDDGITVTASTEQSSFDELFCQVLTKCNVEENVAECLTSFEGSTSTPTDAQFAASVAAGRIHFDATTLEACFNAILAESCDENVFQSRTAPAACAAAEGMASNHGTVVDGGDCFFNQECVSGTCSNSGMNCSESCCPGTCNVTPTIVADGAGCDGTTMVCPTSDTCINGSCRALGAVGADCMTLNDCQDGNTCVNTKCAALPLAGQPCDLNIGCEPAGYSCFAGATGSPTCVANVSRGESCADAPCKLLSTCDATTMKCVALPMVGLPCDSMSCGPGARCDSSSATPTCIALLADGGACTGGQGFVCASGYCDAATNLCAEPEVCGS